MKNTYQNALIVEDDEDLRSLLSKILQQKVDVVSGSDTLTGAQEMVKNKQPDFILLDNNLPDGRGVEYIQKFKAICPHVNIVIISALPNLKEEALKYGADGYIEKPLRLSEINQYLDNTANRP
jgi:response regulator of citrate/malate metabolism